MKNILIDTNIYSHAIRGTQDVISVLQKVRKIFICPVSIGELLSGFKGGSREQENRKELREFLNSPRVHLCYIDENTAEFYADILDNLKRKGTPIPTNDIWISAVALQHSLKLFSKDKHFKYVHGLTLISQV